MGVSAGVVASTGAGWPEGEKTLLATLSTGPAREVTEKPC